MTIRYESPTYERMLGYKAAESTMSGLFAPVHPDDLPIAEANFEELFANQDEVTQCELRVRHRDGTWLNVQAVAINLLDNPSVQGFVIHLYDITERKSAERKIQEQYNAIEVHAHELEAMNDELHRTQERLLEANTQLQITLDGLKSSQEQLLQSSKLAAIGELVSGIAHELNNPLGAISIHSELLLDEVEDGETKEFARIINTQTDRASGIVRNLLSFARKHEPKKTLISLNDWIKSTVELRAYDLRLNNIHTHLELDPDLPNTMADFNQMQQVFLNLINNAEQAMKEAHDKGELVIRTETIGNSIRITFADNGPGIPEEISERVFEPFFTTKEIGKGTGMGLSICYGIIQEHGGQMYVRSAEVEGTAFIIEIPVIHEKAECLS